MINKKQWLFYVFRWQLSSFVLAPVMILFNHHNPWLVASIANFIGANIFIYIDKWIFKSKNIAK